MGLQKDVFTDLGFATAFRMVLGLAYVPRAHIEKAWRMMVESDGFPFLPGSPFSKVNEETLSFDNKSGFWLL